VKASPWPGQSPRTNPAGAGPDTLAEPEPEPGRLILIPLHGEGLPLARPEPQSEHGPRTPRDRDILAEPEPEPEPEPARLIPLHGEGFPLARPEPEDEPGRRWT